MSAMDDRLLEDIGITRSQIRAVADGPLKRELQRAHMLDHQSVRIGHDILKVEGLIDGNHERLAA